MFFKGSHNPISLSFHLWAEIDIDIKTSHTGLSLSWHVKQKMVKEVGSNHLLTTQSYVDI